MARGYCLLDSWLWPAWLPMRWELFLWPVMVAAINPAYVSDALGYRLVSHGVILQLTLHRSAACNSRLQQLDPVCKACFGDIVHPANGRNTNIFTPCFTAVDAACSTNPGHYSFCGDWLSDETATIERASMTHVIAVELWKHALCEWSEAYVRHTPYTSNHEV